MPEQSLSEGEIGVVEAIAECEAIQETYVMMKAEADRLIKANRKIRIVLLGAVALNLASCIGFIIAAITC